MKPRPGLARLRGIPPITWILLLAALLGLAQLGLRGTWDPDEGRYSNIALNMLDSGDWLTPRRADGIAHWTKPPLAYWAVAGSLAVVGETPFAARLPSALGWLACIWLCWAIARRLVPGAQDLAALVYATMLLPIGAAGWLTTDNLLAACMALAMWAYVEARFGGHGEEPAAARLRSARWLLLAWAASGLGFLAKGTPALLPLLVMLVADALAAARSPVPAANPAAHDRRDSRLCTLAGIALFLSIVLPWYGAVTWRTPGLLAYLLGDEVVGRLFDPGFGRHGEWYGWAFVYVPTLLIGTLPWTVTLWRACATLPARARRWRRGLRGTGMDRSALLLMAWIVIPLLLFCLARSRMPLYVLPLCVPLAIVVAAQRRAESRGLPRGLPRALPRWPALAAWIVVVLLLQSVAVHWTTHKDARPWAREIVARHSGPVHAVLFVEDMARYGLHLELGRGTRIGKLSLPSLPSSLLPRQPLQGRSQARGQGFNPAYDRSLEDALREYRPGAVWITRSERWPEVVSRLGAAGFHGTALGAPYQGRVLFEVAPAR